MDDADEARSKLGLGWLVRNRDRGGRLNTVEESVPFLNSIVDALWKRVRASLRGLDRARFTERALRHIEGIEAKRVQWERTFRAVLALRADKESAKRVAMRQLARCNAGAIALRLAVEMALCEAPLDGGKWPGELDLTPLMSDVLMIFHLGGVSDAINKRVMEPEVQIAPNGDVLSQVGFNKIVLEPFGQQFTSTKLDHEASRYEKHFAPDALVQTVEGWFQKEFLEAFEAEFEFSIDELRRFRESMENLALEKQKCVFVAREDEVLSYCGASQLVTPEAALKMLKNLSLWPRRRWDKAPEGYRPKDWYPWKFGRRLSLVSKPIARLENIDNPRYVVSPGLIGDGISHSVSRYYEAEVETSDCRSDRMKHWIDKESNRRGHAFASEVFEAVKAQGYEALLESKMSGLLNEKIDRDLGDVDVLGWIKGGDYVLAIECKDLKFAKTPNEIAEQLNRFGGQILPSGERDDLLKHLDRCDFLRDRLERLAQTLGLSCKPVSVFSIVCFSNPVPVQYVADRFPNVSFITIGQLREGRITGVRRGVQ